MLRLCNSHIFFAGLRLGVEAKARYISICRWLEHQERQDEVEGEREGQDKLGLNSGKQSRPSKPLPDYSQLQRQAKKQQLKVGRNNLSKFRQLFFWYVFWRQIQNIRIVLLLPTEENF